MNAKENPFSWPLVYTVNIIYIDDMAAGDEIQSTLLLLTWIVPESSSQPKFYKFRAMI